MPRWDTKNTSWPGPRHMTDAAGDYRMAELQTENARLQELIAELLIKNHELREMLASYEVKHDRQGVQINLAE
ncbi:MAG TPA: hypothetical protein VGM27_19130 [Acidobacteriaceae bacterium]